VGVLKVDVYNGLVENPEWNGGMEYVARFYMQI
jgi:hypothetical protein